MIAEAYIPVRVTRDPALVREWELVLLSQALAPSVGETLDGFVLSVPSSETAAALAALAAYDQESPRLSPEPVEPPQPISLFWGIVIGELLLLFFFITSLESSAFPWLARGSADAERILHGELWRVVTALTLHADIAHVLSNAAAAAIFFSAVCSMLGAGLGSVALLFAGAIGNYLNALMYGSHGSAHISVGASTAVFGAVGMLGVLGMSKRRRTSMVARRKWLSVAAALALLAMLGTAGQRVDLFAHLFGFAAGALLALFAVRLTYVPGFAIQLLCGAAALALLVYCWYLAFGR